MTVNTTETASNPLRPSLMFSLRLKYQTEVNLNNSLRLDFGVQIRVQSKTMVSDLSLSEI